MNPFIYDIPTKVYFGENQLGNLGKELARFGRRVLLSYGGGSIKKTGLYDQTVKEIRAAGLELFELSGIDPNPRVSSVNAGADLCKKESVDVVLAVGGGSVLDCAKYVAAAAYYDGDAWDILLGKVDVRQCLPVVTVLTLAATGYVSTVAGAAVQQPAEAITGIVLSFSILPAVLMAASLLTLRHYRLRREDIDAATTADA